MKSVSIPVPFERQTSVWLFLAGVAALVANGWAAGVAAGAVFGTGSVASALLLAFAACGLRMGAQLVLGQRQSATAHAHYFAASAGPFAVALVTRDRLPFLLACAMFAVYLLVNVAVARRRLALVLALIGGPAVLLNLAAIAVIAIVAMNGGAPMPAWLAAAAVARSCAGGAWGGRVMLRAVGDAGWHRTFVAWLAWDIVIAACRPSAAALVLTASAVVLHLVVTHVHRLDSAAR